MGRVTRDGGRVILTITPPTSPVPPPHSLSCEPCAASHPIRRIGDERSSTLHPGLSREVGLGGCRTDRQLPSHRPGQPHHAGFGTAETDAAKVTSLVRGIERFSSRTVAGLLADYRARHHVRDAGVVVSSLTDPASIANRHMRAHASEGRLFRTVLVAALEQCGVTVRVILEREVYELLGKALRRSPSEAKHKVAALGEGVGRWRAEQKVAAAAAWLIR